MKKIYVFIIILATLLFLIIYPKHNLDLGGTWFVNKIQLNNENIDGSFVKIDDWRKTIFFEKDHNHQIIANFKIKYDSIFPYMILSSKEKSLNGKFDIKKETIIHSDVYRNDLIINLKLISKKSCLSLYKTIQPNKKTENFPKRGRP